MAPSTDKHRVHNCRNCQTEMRLTAEDRLRDSVTCPECRLVMPIERTKNPDIVRLGKTTIL